MYVASLSLSDCLASIRAKSAAFSLHLTSPAPVAIFIGGTAGISHGASIRRPHEGSLRYRDEIRT